MAGYDDNNQQKAWAKVYEIQGHPSLTNDDRIFLEAILESSGVHGDIDVSHRLLRGYVLYHFGTALTAAHSCEGDLLSVLDDDPENTTALVYLGHFYYDCGKWDLARRYLGRIALDRYITEGQLWRTFKIRELVACCDIMMRDFRCAIGEIPPLIDEMSRADVTDCPIPAELIKSLAANVNSVRQALGSSDLSDWTSKLRALVAALGAADLFSEAFVKLERSS